MKRFRLLTLLGLLLATAILAQDLRGSIVGRVADSTGAVVPDMEVRVTNRATGVVSVAKTSSSGVFAIHFLLPGFYSVTVESTGFKKFVRENVEVRVSESVEIPIAMELGAVSETVQVPAEIALLATTDASQGTVIEDRAIPNFRCSGATRSSSPRSTRR